MIESQQQWERTYDQLLLVDKLLKTRFMLLELAGETRSTYYFGFADHATSDVFVDALERHINSYQRAIRRMRKKDKVDVKRIELLKSTIKKLRRLVKDYTTYNSSSFFRPYVQKSTIELLQLSGTMEQELIRSEFNRLPPESFPKFNFRQL